MSNVFNEYLNSPCHVAAPELWFQYCAMVGRPNDAAEHWLVIDVLNAIKMRGCPSCGEKGDNHEPH